MTPRSFCTGVTYYAAARVAQIMLYAGVKDVRLLDGGWQTWRLTGLPVERGTPPKVKAEPDFGVKIPAQPQLMLDMEQARGLLHRQDASLVSIRSCQNLSVRPAVTAILNQKVK